MDLEKESTIVAEPVKDGMLIHITKGYDDPHSVLMPLKMATMMAVDKDVLVYMDIDAVELLVKEAKDLNYPYLDSAHIYIKQLAEKNVGVFACPTCLKVAGFTPENLMEGVQTAQKDKFFDFTKDESSPWIIETILVLTHFFPMRLSKKPYSTSLRSRKYRDRNDDLF